MFIPTEQRITATLGTIVAEYRRRCVGDKVGDIETVSIGPLRYSMKGPTETLSFWVELRSSRGLTLAEADKWVRETLVSSLTDGAIGGHRDGVYVQRFQSETSSHGGSG